MNKRQISVTVSATYSEGQEERNLAFNNQEFEILLSSNTLAVQADGVADVIGGCLKVDLLNALSNLLDE